MGSVSKKKPWFLKSGFRSSWDIAAREATNWLMPYEALQIARMAHEIWEQNPNSRVFSLGQSPAWIVKALEKEAALKKLDYKTGYIPFSGSFFLPADVLEQNKDLYCYSSWDGRTNLCERINRHRMDPYRKVLEKIGMSPESIIDHFTKNNATTTITEIMGQSGGGAASFLYVLFSWAKDDGAEASLREAVNVRLYNNSQLDLPFSLRIEGFDPIPCNFHPIDSDLRDTLMNCRDNVRIVPYYPSEKWLKEPGSPEGDPRILQNTEEVLGEAVVITNFAPNLYDKWRMYGRAAVKKFLPRDAPKAVSSKRSTLASVIGETPFVR
ncbi:MAG: hypothetical protein P4M13_05935 [Alphaproteobacteria bacterium]|nr:hypothetical protein [Alphaproteobacteria bacterium]